jgi:hypothetical protein
MGASFMGKLALDFAAPEKAEQYPAHGWAVNSQGVPILWLPIRRVLMNVNKIRKAKGLTSFVQGNSFENICVCIDTLAKLTKSCQELSRIVRKSNEHPSDLHDIESLDKFLEANQRAPYFYPTSTGGSVSPVDRFIAAFNTSLKMDGICSRVSLDPSTPATRRLLLPTSFSISYRISASPCFSKYASNSHPKLKYLFGG